MRVIRALTVEYEDGSTDKWEGPGSVGTVDMTGKQVHPEAVGRYVTATLDLMAAGSTDPAEHTPATD